MRSWYLALIVILLLAACSGAEEDTGPEVQAPEPSPIATEDGTPEVDPYPLGPQLQPGFQVLNGLTIVSSQVFTDSDKGLGYIFLEVENSTERAIGNINLSLSLLDSNNYERASLQIASPLLNIPPGLRLPLGQSFNLPPDYSGVAGLLSVNEDAALSFSLNAQYELPLELEIPTDLNAPLNLSGTVSNDRGQTLVSPVVMVGVYDAEGAIVGAGLAIPEGLTSTGEWAPEADLSFSLTISTLAGPAAEVRALAVAYGLP